MKEKNNLSLVAAVIFLAASLSSTADAVPCDLQVPEICWVTSARGTADIGWRAVPEATAYWLGFSFGDGSFAALKKVPVPPSTARGGEDRLDRSMQARLVHGQIGALRYFFAVRAVRETDNAYCESAWSDGWAALASNALAAVTNLRVTKQTENAHLTWDPVLGADFYLVSRTKIGDLPGGWVTMAAVPALLPEEWDDPVIFDGESYSYSVTAQTAPAMSALRSKKGSR